MVTIENKALKILMLEQIESLIQFFSILRNIDKKVQSPSEEHEEEDEGLGDFESDLNPKKELNEVKYKILLDQMKLFVAGHRNKIEKFQKIFNKEFSKKNKKIENFCDYNLNWEQLELPDKMSEFEIREKVDSSLDFISGFFYNLGQSSQTIPLSLGLLPLKSKEDGIIEEEDEIQEESIMEITQNVN